MSTRAIRALRGDADSRFNAVSSTAAVSEVDDDDDDNDDEEEDEIDIPSKRATAFTMLNTDDSDDDDDDDDHDENEVVDDEKVEIPERDDDNNKLNDSISRAEVKKLSSTKVKNMEQKHDPKTDENNNDNDDNEEDIDAILSEFQEKDLIGEGNDNGNDDTSLATASCPYDVIVSNIDIRDFDYQYTMRTSIFIGENGNDVSSSRSTTTRSKLLLSNLNHNNNSLLFGPPIDGWIRPPRYIGGGMGLFSYNDDHLNMNHNNTSSSVSDATIATTPPWPYINNTKYDNDNNNQDVSTTTTAISTTALCNPKRWYTFFRSDQAKRDVQDYFTIQQSNGDINMLIMFIAHHPYVPEALLQLSNVLYQTNHTSEGYAMLRRCLYTYETSFPINFINHIIVQERTYFIDMYQRNENRIFFQALFRYIQISHIAGLNRTALATCRLLLSFDQLRDPMNVLLALDYHTIMVSRRYGYNDQINLLNWLVQLVDNNSIPIWYQDDKIAASHPTTYCGTLLDLPNWSYSYALALFDIQKAMQCLESDDECHYERVEEVRKKADMAIQNAMSRFPSIVGYLLHHLDVDTTGRSFQRDWVTVLDHAAENARSLIRHWYNITTDSIVLSATVKVCDLIAKIFAEQNSKLYGDDDVLQWIYDNLVILKERESISATHTGVSMPPVPNPAVLRYAKVDPNDYSTKVQTLPPDANIIDNALLQHAMTIDLRRPRYLRHNQRRDNNRDDNDMDDIQYDELGNPFLPQQRVATTYFGPPTEAIDPDWPMTEVFLRSILPWNYVEGLPPPRR